MSRVHVPIPMVIMSIVINGGSAMYGIIEPAEPPTFVRFFCP